MENVASLTPMRGRNLRISCNWNGFKVKSCICALNHKNLKKMCCHCEAFYRLIHWSLFTVFMNIKYGPEIFSVIVS